MTMGNKKKINNLKDYAELAWASYFYFDLDECVLKENDIKITTNEIISLSYNGKMAGEKEKIGEEYHFISKKKLNGEFSEIQAKNFAQRYKIYFHQPNTLSGFSATLFYDTQEDRFVVGFRGTELNIKTPLETSRDLAQDLSLSLNANPQSSALLDFLIEVSRFVKIYNKRTIFVGHSLGGYLAQWALIYCDSLYKDKLKFSPSEVYTFNAPSIDGWNFPSPIINPNTIKILQEIFNKRSIDISDKITHIYDNGGIKLIASAQYGSSNRLPIYTGNDSHSIVPLTQTLYFYSYLLELESNNTTIQKTIANRQSNKANNTNTDSKIPHKDNQHNANRVSHRNFTPIQNANVLASDSTHAVNNRAIQIHNTLADYIYELNMFMDNIKTYVLTFVDTTNEENIRNFNRKNGPFTLVRKKPESINFFPYFLSKVAVIVGESPSVLKDSGDNYHERHKQLNIRNEDIIDFVIKLQEKQFYVCICNEEYFNVIRKEIKKINDKENLGEKITLGTHRNFYMVDKNNVCVETYENIIKAYGYKSEEYTITQQIWEQEYLGALCKVSQALYANGKAHIGIQYAK